MKLSKYATSVIVLGLLAACVEREVILPGERFGIRDVLSSDGATPQAVVDAPPQNQAVPITLAAQRNYSAWTHRAGEPDHSIQHPALSAAPQVFWSARIGQGNSRRFRISADPVVADGRIFTLDSRSLIMAHSLDGNKLWQVSLVPESDRADDASGGGLAIEGAQIYATTGFGTVTALDVASGTTIWSQQLDAPISGAPSVVSGVVYVSSKDSRAYAIDATTGRIKWQLAGTPDVSGIVGTSSPAITDQLAIFPFSSGELVAASRQDGTRVWGALVAGQRQGRGYSNITDITGEPVVSNGIIYAGNPVGRTIAMSLSGERIWTAKEGATGPVWVAGGSVFLISDEAKLIRLGASDGEQIWAVDLPYFTQQSIRRRKAVYANFGPVLAGGNLWVASSDGVMRGFNPVDGSLTVSIDIPGGAASRPIVVNGVAYLVTTKGHLLALR